MVSSRLRLPTKRPVFTSIAAEDGFAGALAIEIAEDHGHVARTGLVDRDLVPPSAADEGVHEEVEAVVLAREREVEVGWRR